MMPDLNQTVRQSIQSKLDAAKAEVAELEKQLASLHPDFLDKAIGAAIADFHKLIGWV